MWFDGRSCIQVTFLQFESLFIDLKVYRIIFDLFDSLHMNIRLNEVLRNMIFLLNLNHKSLSFHKQLL